MLKWHNSIRNFLLLSCVYTDMTHEFLFSQLVYWFLTNVSHTGVLSVKTEFMKGHAMKTDPRYILVSLYQTITKLWLCKMVMLQILSFFMRPFTTCCTRITHLFKQGRYSYRSNARIQHGKFDLRLENSW